jgi:hypothetical protein
VVRYAAAAAATCSSHRDHQRDYITCRNDDARDRAHGYRNASSGGQ